MTELIKRISNKGTIRWLLRFTRTTNKSRVVKSFTFAEEEDAIRFRDEWEAEFLLKGPSVLPRRGKGQTRKENLYHDLKKKLQLRDKKY